MTSRASHDIHNELMAIALLLNAFIVWTVTQTCKDLWPGASIRPMALPLLVIIIEFITIVLCIPFCQEMNERKRYGLTVLGLLIGFLPIFIGMGTFSLMTHLTGLTLAP